MGESAGKRVARAVAQDGTQIQRTARGRFKAARQQRWHRQGQGLGNLLGEREFGDRHGFEIGFFEAFAFG